MIQQFKQISIKQRFFLIIITFILTLFIKGVGEQISYGKDINNQDHIIGQWRSQIQFSTGAFASIKNLEFMYVFNYGGTMIESSNYDAAPPVPPAYGIWRKIDSKKFEIKYEYYATQPPDKAKIEHIWGGWLPSTRGVLSEIITLADDNETFNSTIKYEAFDQNGNIVEGGGIATGKGIKLKF
ncbi:hypothetical protein [Geminocystis sp. GBBB08]|uniref:hypothetical protein n=1 Tax=Geminocystis sp. GBBB08 TaxID=2604140 RepID=UPI0027E27473|nr:hypothetical protein [Geminocystis sp. GBBB08]MBL1210932.1 hypothetical protein [Geminocystis sp. GBBB08]